MSQKRERFVDFVVSPDVLLEILTSPEFLVAEQEADEGNESARYQEISRTSEHVAYEVDITEYGRSMRGEIDRSKREQAKLIGSWDLRTRRATWTYKSITSPMADRISASGTYRIEPAGERARLHASFDLSIKVPLIGAAIEKMVLKDIKKGEAKYDALVREFIARQG